MGYGNELQTRPIEMPEEPDGDEERNDWTPRAIYSSSPAGDLAHEISRVVFEIQRMPMVEVRDHWPEISQFFSDVAARIPGITEGKGAQFIRDWEDLSDIVNSEGFENIAKSKLLKHLYALRVEVSVSEHPLQGLSGVSSLLTTKNESKQNATINDGRPKEPQSIFSGVMGLLGKKEQPPQGRGGGPA